MAAPTPSLSGSIKNLSAAEAAYVAGVIDGEGTVTLTRTHRGENRRPIISISSTEMALLNYVRQVTGVGKITRKVRARDYHSQAYAYTVSSRVALALLEQVTPYLQTYKKQRAQLLLGHYRQLTPRNGKYSPELRARKTNFENSFFAVSVRGRKPAARIDPTA